MRAAHGSPSLVIKVLVEIRHIGERLRNTDQTARPGCAGSQGTNFPVSATQANDLLRICQRQARAPSTHIGEISERQLGFQGGHLDCAHGCGERVRPGNVLIYLTGLAISLVAKRAPSD